MEKKITKREKFEAIITAIETGEWVIDTDEIRAFAENEIALLDKKASKAKERQATKKAEGDALTDAIYEALTDEFAVIADITAKVAEVEEDVTVAKVTYRLGQLVKNGKAENGDVKIPGTDGQKTRIIKAYKLAD